MKGRVLYLLNTVVQGQIEDSAISWSILHQIISDLLYCVPGGYSYTVRVVVRCSNCFNGARRLGQAYILFLIAKITVHHIERFTVVGISRKYSNIKERLQRAQNINNDEKRVRTALPMNVTSCSNILSTITQSSDLCVFALLHFYRENKIQRLLKGLRILAWTHTNVLKDIK